MNKKAQADLVIKFLATIVIAIIVFVPACVVGGKLFRTSDQAKDDYVDFVNELNRFVSQARVGLTDTSTLIMDEGTALVYFERVNYQGEDEAKADGEAPPGVRVFVDSDFEITDPVTYIASDYYIVYERPHQCVADKNCICLFRDIEATVESGWFADPTLYVAPNRYFCNPVEYTLEVSSCSFGTPVRVNSQQCESGGFAIERGLATEATVRVISYYENPRRRTFSFEKIDVGHVRIAEVTQDAAIGIQDQEVSADASG